MVKCEYINNNIVENRKQMLLYIYIQNYIKELYIKSKARWSMVLYMCRVSIKMYLLTLDQGCRNKFLRGRGEGGKIIDFLKCCSLCA